MKAIAKPAEILALETIVVEYQQVNPILCGKVKKICSKRRIQRNPDSQYNENPKDFIKRNNPGIVAMPFHKYSIHGRKNCCCQGTKKG